MVTPMRTQQRLGVYAGTFDPLTVGHLWMIEEGSRLFDRLTVGVGVNPGKSYNFPLEDRVAMLRESTGSFRNVSVASFSNRYLIDYAHLVGATHILRGIRTESDYEFERTMRNINGDLDDGICTVFLMPPPENRGGELEHGSRDDRPRRMEKDRAQICACPCLQTPHTGGFLAGQRPGEKAVFRKGCPACECDQNLASEATLVPPVANRDGSHAPSSRLRGALGAGRAQVKECSPFQPQS